MILIMVCVNGITVPWLMDRMGMGRLLLEGSPEAERISLAVKAVDTWLLMSIGLMWRRRTHWVGLLAGSASYCFASLLAVILFMLFTNPIVPGRWTFLRLLIPVAGLYLLARWLHRVAAWSADAPKRRLWQGMALVFSAVMAVGLVLEGVFMFVGKTSQNDNALASKVWFARNWELNTQGYRDFEDEKGDTGSRHLLLVGDSYLAGHGVRDTADRFSNRIQRALGGGWRVHNHGQNGASAEDISNQMQIAGGRADAIVYCWFVNDILGPAQDILGPRNAGLKPPSPISPVAGSYLINYLYHLFPDEEDGRDYYAYLKSCYASTKVLGTYHSILAGLNEQARLGHSRFGVVLFPTMDLMQMEGIPVANELAFWDGIGVPCLYLGPAIEGHAASELIVNGSDHHPNALGHELAADAILKWLPGSGLLD